MRPSVSYGFLVVAEGPGRLVERNFLAQPVGDVRQVAESGGVVPFEDVGVQVLDLAAADGRDEVAEVAPARPAADFGLHQARERNRLGFSLGIELAVHDAFPLRDGRCCPPSTVEVIGFQAADLEDELGVAVVHDADLGVGRLALVVIAEPAAQAQ